MKFDKNRIIKNYTIFYKILKKIDLKTILFYKL